MSSQCFPGSCCPGSKCHDSGVPWAAFYVFQTLFKHLLWIDLSYCDIQSLTMHHMRVRHRPLTTEQMQGFLIADVRSLESAQSCEV